MASTVKWRKCLFGLCRCLQLNHRFIAFDSCRLGCALHTDRFQGDGFSACDITSSEALRALRPFYLAVHPDLFARFPRERTANENSLKKLNSYLDALESGCGQGHSTTYALRPKPVHLTFFIKRRKSESLMTVSVSLNAHSIGSAVHDILKSCDLFADISNPTISKLIRIKHQESQKHRVLSTYKHYRSRNEPHNIHDYPDFDYAFSGRWINFGHVQRKQPECLKTWLRQNLSLAKSRLDLSKILKEENRLLIESICSRYRLQSITVDSDWTETTVKGHLLSLDRALECIGVAELTEKSGTTLGSGRGLRFVLGHSSHVSLEGEVHLSCEDTVQQWLQYLMSNASSELALLREIDTLEKQLLETINHERQENCGSGSRTSVIFKRPTTISPAEYKALITEYIRRCREKSHDFPHNLPGTAAASATCDHHELGCSDSVVISIVMKSKSGTAEPFLVEDGSLEVPLDCPLRSLEDFCTKHHYEINKTREKHKRSKDEMLQSIETCKEKLQLSELTVKANISSEQVKVSCSRLLQLVDHHSGAGEVGKETSELLELSGHHLCLANSFSISSDGKVKIPWDFKII